MRYNFPEVQTTRKIYQQWQKIQDELFEFYVAPKGDRKDEEAVDILHAVETFIRLHFKERDEVLKSIVKQVKAHNKKRGYYSQSCF